MPIFCLPRCVSREMDVSREVHPLKMTLLKSVIYGTRLTGNLRTTGSVAADSHLPTREAGFRVNPLEWRTMRIEGKDPDSC